MNSKTYVSSRVNCHIIMVLSRDADRSMSGKTGVVAIWVIQPLCPFRVPFNVICSDMVTESCFKLKQTKNYDFSHLNCQLKIVVKNGSIFSNILKKSSNNFFVLTKKIPIMTFLQLNLKFHSIFAHRRSGQRLPFEIVLSENFGEMNTLHDSHLGQCHVHSECFLFVKAYVY